MHGYEDLVRDYNQGRIVGERALTRLIEQRQRDIKAHSNAQALKQVREVLDRAHPGADVCPECGQPSLPGKHAKGCVTGMFPPSAPYNGDDDPDSPTGPGGHYQPKINRPVIDRQKRASAYLSDEELEYRLLYPPGTRFEPGED